VDKREAILARLTTLCASVTGISAAGRNRLDVAGLARPAVIIQDGTEERIDGPLSDNRSAVQRMELSPQLWLLVRAGADDAGPLMSLFRARLVYAITTDTTLRDLTGTTGGIRYEGCSTPEPTPETKEPRLDINFVFTYALRTADLGG
jgi:hypothetical protein